MAGPGTPPPSRGRDTPGVDGLVVVDKPAGWTSHDVVARMRRIAGTRRVGHAGTLDPMATGVLVIGMGRATRLLGHLALTEKVYAAVIRLGATTNTDDAEGEVLTRPGAAGVADADVVAGVAALTGEIEQVPPQVSAIKVGGVRSYARARRGEEVAHRPRPVRVYGFEPHEIRRHGDLVDVVATVSCSSGTYIRSLARDLGAALGVGGHLVELRRTRVGPFDIGQAVSLERLASDFTVLPLEEAVGAAFPRRTVGESEARVVAHGGRLPPAGLGDGPVGVFGPGGRLLALMRDVDAAARPLVVFADPGGVQPGVPTPPEPSR